MLTSARHQRLDRRAPCRPELPPERPLLCGFHPLALGPRFLECSALALGLFRLFGSGGAAGQPDLEAQARIPAGRQTISMAILKEFLGGRRHDPAVPAAIRALPDPLLGVSVPAGEGFPGVNVVALDVPAWKERDGARIDDAVQVVAHLGAPAAIDIQGTVLGRAMRQDVGHRAGQLGFHRLRREAIQVVGVHSRQCVGEARHRAALKELPGPALERWPDGPAIPPAHEPGRQPLPGPVSILEKMGVTP